MRIPERWDRIESPNQARRGRVPKIKQQDLLGDVRICEEELAVGWQVVLYVVGQRLVQPVSPPAGPPPGKPFGPPVSPPVGPPLSPPVGPALSPPVGPPLNPPAGPPDHWFDFEQPLNEHWPGCREIVLIQGIERVKSDTRTGPSDNELFRFTIVRDAVGIGLSTGNQYEVSFREQLVAVGWPPLTPPTSNITSYGATLTLGSADSNERFRVVSHRVIHWDDELGEATFTGTFVKDWERCK